jgi:hypothetical protein
MAVWSFQHWPHVVAILGQYTAFYTLFTVSLHPFYGSFYGAFMTSRLWCVMLSRVPRRPPGGALPGGEGQALGAAGQRFHHERGGSSA